MKLLKRIKEFFTPLTAQPPFMVSLPRTNYDYATEVGDGLGSSVLMSPIKWVQRTFPEARLEVVELKKDEEDIVFGHALTNLITRPNPYYTATALWSGTIYSLVLSGDGYWIKVRRSSKSLRWYEDVTGEVVELWYVPHWMMWPRWPLDGSQFISHYEYRLNGQTFEVAPENVIHFRNGIDPRDPRHGLSLVYSELREIFTDDEAANFCASLLRNMGVPGIVVSPDASAGGTAIAGDPDELKAYIQSKFQGDKRGEAVVFTAPTKIQQYGFDPKVMELGSIRDSSEERICAALGIPSAVVGFGSGMDQTKVGATMMALKRLAWEGCLIPMQGGLSEQLTLSLLPEFEPKPERFQVRFNHKMVSALQDNRLETARATAILVQSGQATVGEGRKANGYEPGPGDDVYLRSTTTVEVPRGTIRQSATPAPPKHRKSKDNPTPQERFGETLDRLEAEGAARIAARFEIERTRVIDALS